MLSLALALFLNGNAVAITPNGNLTILDNLMNADFALSPEQKDFVLKLHPGPHSLNFGILLRTTPVRDNTFFHINYSYNLKMASFLNYKASIGIGFLDSSYSGSRSILFIGETMTGARNYLEFVLGPQNKKHTKISVGAGRIQEIWDDERGWDNLSLEARMQNYVLGITSDLRLSRKFFNEDRYWFIKRKNFINYKLGPQFSIGNFQLLPFGGLDIGEYDRDKYSNTLHGGLAINLQTSQKQSWRLQLLYGIDWAQKTRTTVLSLGENIQKTKKSGGGTWEIFGLQRTGDPWQKETVGGAKITIQTLNFQKKNEGKPNLPTPDDYRDSYKKSDFYAEFGFQDNLNLNIYEQARRLNSLRLRNEWSGRNLFYSTAGLPTQMPNMVYNNRTGDCDDQALLNTWIDRQNGYPSYVLSYWPSDLDVAHAVEIVQDPRTGRWFMDEYGVLQEIKVDPNAPLDVVAWEALKQGIRFSALPSEDPDMFYWVSAPTDDPNKFKKFVIPYTWRHDFQSTAGTRPRLAKGFELFAGPDALWR